MIEYCLEAISTDHHIQFFCSGEQSLDDWLNDEACNAHNGGLSRTHVWVDPEDEDREVKAYFTLLPTSIRDQGISKRKAKFDSDDGYPGYLLAKLALHADLRSSEPRLGPVLLADAMRTTLTAADAAGGRYLVVDPIEDTEHAARVRKFYSERGFLDIEGSNRMYIDISTVRRIAQQAGTKVQAS